MSFSTVQQQLQKELDDVKHIILSTSSEVAFAAADGVHCLQREIYMRKTTTECILYITKHINHQYIVYWMVLAAARVKQ